MHGTRAGRAGREGRKRIGAAGAAADRRTAPDAVTVGRISAAGSTGVRTRGRQDRGTGPSRPSVTVRATLQQGARAGTRAGEAVREERNLRRPRPGHRLPPAGDDCPDTGDRPPGPATATVDVGPGYLPGSPAPATVEDLITVVPTVPSTRVPARLPPIPHTAHRPRRGVQSAVGEDRQPCAARALSSRANAASRACAVPRRPV